MTSSVTVSLNGIESTEEKKHVQINMLWAKEKKRSYGEIPSPPDF